MTLTIQEARELDEQSADRLRSDVQSNSAYYNGRGLRLVAPRMSDGGAFTCDIYHFKESTIVISMDAPTGVTNLDVYCSAPLLEDIKRDDFLDLVRERII